MRGSVIWQPDVIAIFISLSRLLNEQRDSYGKKQALRAMEYIDKNYMNSDVSLNSVRQPSGDEVRAILARFLRRTQERPLSRRSQERGWKRQGTFGNHIQASLRGCGGGGLLPSALFQRGV